MHFLKRLFGSVSKSNKKNDYARATLEYATNPQVYKSDAIVCYNRRLAFNAKGEYDQPVLDYARALRIKTNKAVTVMNIGVTGSQKQRISVTFYRYFTSQTYLSISRC